MLFREKKFIVPVSSTATHAIMQAENLKRELQANQTIKKIFGPVKTKNVDYEASFSKEMWETSYGTVVLPRGSGQQVRGLIVGNHRPDLIIVDDLEDPEHIDSEDYRAKTKEWFFADLCNAVQRASDKWKIIFIGTVLHQDALLVNLLEDPSWKSVRLEMFDDNYKSNWPQFLSDNKVLAMVEDFRRRGMLDTLFREYKNLPISKEDASFKQEYFKYYDDSKKMSREIETVIIVDPAKTVKLWSAESAILAVGIDVIKHHIYVREVMAEKMHPNELYDNMFAMAIKYGARVIGIEVTSLNEFITYPIKNEMIKRGRFFELVELKPREKKENRARALVPFYTAGYIYHNRSTSLQLEEQLMTFPKCKRWDAIDALAYVIELLDIGERFFGPSHDDDDSKVEDEYSELYDPEDEKPIGEWRVA
jgi:predicted phage terminase large subunit-like protein